MISYAWFPKQSEIDLHRAQHPIVCPELPGAFDDLKKHTPRDLWVDYEAFSKAYPHVADAVYHDDRCKNGSIFPSMIDLYQQGYTIDTWNGEWSDLYERPWRFVGFMSDGSFMGFEIPPSYNHDNVYYQGYEGCSDDFIDME